jgi:hypothetical protein
MVRDHRMRCLKEVPSSVAGFGVVDKKLGRVATYGTPRRRLRRRVNCHAAPAQPLKGSAEVFKDCRVNVVVNGQAIGSGIVPTAAIASAVRHREVCRQMDTLIASSGCWLPVGKTAEEKYRKQLSGQWPSTGRRRTACTMLSHTALGAAGRRITASTSSDMT